MKIIFLNVWNGKQESEIKDFFKLHAPTTDVFCLQEAYDEFRKMISEYMGDFNETHHYLYGFKTPIGNEDWAQATYVRKNIRVMDSKFLYNSEKASGLGIATALEYEGKLVNVFNYHGVSNPKDKIDSPERLSQSRHILEYFKDKEGAKILGGDFNFLPDIESYKMLADNYRELVKEYKTPTTRSDLYLKHRSPAHLFSDYIFISPEIEVKNFSVPNIEVSDHLPLILEVNF